MNEAYDIVTRNTSIGRGWDKVQRDLKSILILLETVHRVFVRNITPPESRGNLNTFWEQKIHVIDEKMDSEGLVYSVKEVGKSNSKKRTLQRNNIMS